MDAIVVLLCCAFFAAAVVVYSMGEYIHIFFPWVYIYVDTRNFPISKFISI